MSQMLHASRTRLRPVEKTDLPLYQQWFSRYELVRTVLPMAIRLVNREAEEAWFQATCADPHTFFFAIDDAEGRLIGSTSLMKVDGKNRSAVFGIVVADPAARGRGHGGEAIDMMLEFGFLELNLNRIELRVFELNPRARALYARKGFQLEGTLRQALFREGRYWDEHVMAILREACEPRAHWGLDGQRS